jgi:beta-lactamase class A
MRKTNETGRSVTEFGMAGETKVRRRGVLFGLGGIGLGAVGLGTLGFGVVAPGGGQPALAAKGAGIDLADLEARHGGRLGVAASRDGRTLSWRGEERFAYCSTFKLFLAAAVLARVDRGDERLDRPVAITKADMLPHAPVTEPALGGTLPIETLCRAAAEQSDNPAANILIRELGGLAAWAAWYPAIGDRTTRVDRPEMELNSAVPGDPRDTTMPERTVANLQAVLLGDVLSAESRDRLTGWCVSTPTGPNRIKAGAPEGWTVAHKTGTGRSPVNDIGVLTPPEGPPLTIALYYTEMRKAPLAEREAVLAEATRRVVAALAG